MKLWAARLCIGAVLAWNMQAALSLLFWPQAGAASFELLGAPGAAAARGMGVLFVMWNVPYAAALWHPQRNRLALGLALVMQAIGLLGETWILAALPPAHALARAAIVRFIAFDAAGLLLLALAQMLTASPRRKASTAANDARATPNNSA